MTIMHNRLSFDQEEERAAIQVLRSGWVAQGKEVVAFETEFCDFLGLPAGHAVAVSSGTAAIFIALTVLKVKKKKVAIPAYACSALLNALVMAEAKPAVIDVENNSPNLDLGLLKKTKARLAIIPHMFGLPIDLSSLPDNLDVIEDCAQALGSFIGKVPVGLQGKIGIYSFYATKLMTSGGQGGMLVSKDKGLVAAIRDYREFDQRRDSLPRFNFQMTDLQAAIGRVQLKKMPQFIQRREEIFQMYQQAGLSLMDVSNKTSQPVRYRAVLRTKKPSEVINKLKALGIRAIIPIEGWELLAKRPKAQKLTQETVSLPIYPNLTDNDVRLIIKAVKNT